MKKYSLLSLFTLALFATGFAQKPAPIGFKFDLDLNHIKDDMAKVTLAVPALGQSKLTYRLPKMVPGTYHIYDFGRFIRTFVAKDTNGKELQVNHIDDDTWEITGAEQLATIEYNVEDTYDTDKDNVIFEPAGTSIEEGKAVVLNNFGFFGYFEGYTQYPYFINVTHPAEFFGSTSLKRIGGSKESDTYQADNYHYLADGPILYCKPDTTTLNVQGTKVLISVYSPNKKVTAKDLVKEIGPTLDAQRKYLGGKLPVDHYSFLVYLSDKPSLSGSAGALEHSYSSFYYLFEGEPKDIAQEVRDVAAHEFFHIVTPLSIHAEQIGNFDFYKPRMSEHLWMYEGQTEYAAHLAQVQGGMKTFEDFLDKMAEKMRQKESYKDNLSFTEMSKGCLDTFVDQYQNVYYKGALITMCLDIKLRQLSKGKYGVQNLMKDLSNSYGKDKSFKDEELFPKIVSLTYPEIKQFLEDYIRGSKPLPFTELLKLVGVEYQETGKVKSISPLFGIENQGAIDFDYATGHLRIEDADKLDDMGKKIMGFKKHDVLAELNGEELTAATIQKVLAKYLTSVKEGSKVTCLVLRDGKQVLLKGKVKKIEKSVKHYLKPMRRASKEQKALRTAWLGNYKEK